MTGIQDIVNERIRQQSDEGWTPEHDDEHLNGELAAAAACYAEHASESEVFRSEFDGVPLSWPKGWDWSWWKPTDRRRDLVKAGALILAEIDRLDRAERGASK